MIEERELTRGEIKRIWTIDRAEVIDSVYYVKDGSLVLRREHHDVTGWSLGQPEKATPVFEECYDNGQWFYGLFETGHLIGVVVLGSQLFGVKSDFLQLKFLYLSRSFRNRGLGKQLFRAATVEARKRGATRLYISATSTKNTVDFYLSLGCRVLPNPDPKLFEEEPEDIHLDYEIR